MKKIKYIHISAFALLLLAAVFFMAKFLPSDVPGEDSNFSIHFIDVGQADSAVLQCSGKTMIIDGGNVADSSTVVAYLRKLDVDYIDYMICTHGHEDHVGGLSGALNYCPVGKIYCSQDDYNSTPFSNFKKYARQQNLEITVPEPFLSFEFGDALVEILGPQKKYDKTNNNSIVLKITYGNNKFLFMGDAETDAEKDMIDAGADLKADVLKLGHHGSDTSTSYVFLNEVMPEYTVISVGSDNKYGHPCESTMSKLRDAGTKVYRTDMQGDIVVTSDGENITVYTDRNQNADTNPADKASDKWKDSEKVYIGNTKSKKYHTQGCRSVPSEKNSIYFNSARQAEEEGYSACKSCIEG